MSLRFIVSEGLAGLSRAKLPFMISVMTITLTLSMIGIGILGVDNALAYLHSLQAEFDAEVFFDGNASDLEIARAMEIASEVPGIADLDFLSKEDAALIFQQEFGEDIMNILDDNPLPASLRVRFEQVYRTEFHIRRFMQDMQRLNGVDEVIFRLDIFERLQTILRLVYAMAGAVLFILIVAAVFLTSNTIRLMILARFDVIETTRLLGASDFHIKAPFFLEGGIQGLVGALFAVGIIHSVEEMAIRLLGVTLHGRLLEFPGLVAGVLLLGITVAALGSLRAVRRFLRYIV